jgi:hypothetical protein
MTDILACVQVTHLLLRMKPQKMHLVMEVRLDV